MKHRILIADDDEQVLNLLRRFLQDQLGYDVTTVNSGEAALEAGMLNDFDLCILDSCLPTCSGTEVYTRLRNMQPTIEAIFFTGNEQFDQTMDYIRFALPKERLLRKPLEDLGELTRLIISILGPPTP